MTFSRAKSAGWSNDVDTITATEINAIDTNQSRAVDGFAGGIYTPTGSCYIQGTGGFRADLRGQSFVRGTGTTGLVLFEVGSLLAFTPGADISDANNQTISPANGLTREFTVPTGARAHDLVSPVAFDSGTLLTLIRPAGGAFNIVIRRSGFAGDDLVTLQASTWASATFYIKGGVWRMYDCSALALAGLQA